MVIRKKNKEFALGLGNKGTSSWEWVVLGNELSSGTSCPGTGCPGTGCPRERVVLGNKLSAGTNCPSTVNATKNGLLEQFPALLLETSYQGLKGLSLQDFLYLIYPHPQYWSQWFFFSILPLLHSLCSLWRGTEIPGAASWNPWRSCPPRSRENTHLSAEEGMMTRL